MEKISKKTIEIAGPCKKNEYEIWLLADLVVRVTSINSQTVIVYRSSLRSC